MKKTAIILISIVLMLLLVFRIFYKHKNGVANERQWYVKELNFDFTASVDSVFRFGRSNHGLVYFHVTHHQPDFNKENRLNSKLKYSGNLRFILPMRNNTLAFHGYNITNYNSHDSLVIDTSRDKIFICRNGKQIAENSISPYISGRPF